MTVSILIVNYRAYDELARCLASIAPWRGDDVEVVVADHASDAGAVAGLRARFPWARVIDTTENPGFAAGVNRAASVASGRHLLLLNPDSLAPDDVCRPLAAWLDANPGVGAVGALVRDEDGSIQATARRFPGLSTVLGGRSTLLTRILPGNPWTRRNLLTGPHVRRPIAVDWVAGSCVVLRRAAFDAVGGMDEGFFLYWEDADLCRRLRSAGWSTMYHPGVEVTHLGGRSSAKARAASLDAFHASVFRYFRKHAGPIARLATPVVWLGIRARRLLAR